MRRRAVFLFLGFFALYALFAQRGLGWGDSGEFQHWILDGVDWSAKEGFSNLHPLYLVLARAVASTPYQVTLISSFFGALAVVGFFLCSRCAALSVLFGLSHALWWMASVAECYTLSLTILAFETLFLLRFWETNRGGWLVALAFLNGLHLELHNLALLALPVYAAVLLVRRPGWRWVLAVGAAWCVGAAYWLWSLAMRGPTDVLVGAYGAQVAGLLPKNGMIAVFNWALAAMSFFVPAALAWWSRTRRAEARCVPWPLWALLAVHFLFWVRYFIISQFTFVLPSVFFAYLLASRFVDTLRPPRVLALAALQVMLPVMAYLVLSRIGFPTWYWSHPGRDDASYFALPWKFHDDSADRCAAVQDGAWDGYYHPNAQPPAAP